jgi:hypothetical protein
VHDSKIMSGVQSLQRVVSQGSFRVHAVQQVQQLLAAEQGAMLQLQPPASYIAAAAIGRMKVGRQSSTAAHGLCNACNASGCIHRFSEGFLSPTH